MPKIFVKKAFTLQHEGEKQQFAVGNHSVPKEIADHWFVKAHIGDEPVTDPDTSAAADELLAELEAKAKELDERETALKENHGILQSIREEQDAKALALGEREKAADQRETDLNARAEALDTREVAIAEREKAEAAAKQTGKK